MIKVRPNYRLLNDGERIKKGDLFLLSKPDVWAEMNEMHVGRTFNIMEWFPVSRKNEFKTIPYSPEEKQLALHKLKKKKALNEDSALKITEEKLDLYYTLSQDKVIGIIDENRFFLKKYE